LDAVRLLLDTRSRLGSLLQVNLGSRHPSDGISGIQGERVDPGMSHAPPEAEKSGVETLPRLMIEVSDAELGAAGGPREPRSGSPRSTQRAAVQSSSRAAAANRSQSQRSNAAIIHTPKG